MSKIIPVPRNDKRAGISAESETSQSEPQLNIDQLADYVYDLLKRDLRITRERMGSASSTQLQ
ncbi:MAG: hypothetical protein AAF629_07290 [Chloroflexota bacterium]